jgi:hypothetical protein
VLGIPDGPYLTQASQKAQAGYADQTERLSAAGYDLVRVAIGRDGEHFEPLIVEPQIKLALPVHAQDFFVSASLQVDRNLVFRVHRETMANCSAATRANRRIFAHAIELLERALNCVGLILHRHRGIAHSRAADLACRRQLALLQERRYRQHVSDIVEAVADVVGR